jgi:hypothetical protein
MSVNNTNLYSESFTQIKAFLNSISGLDPKNRSRPNWLHASMPAINSKGFEGYPFIVIKIDINEENKSFDNSTSQKIFKILLGIYSTESTDVDTISDEIFSNLKTETKLTDFSARELSSSPMNYLLDQNGKKVLYRNIGGILKSRI